MENAKLLTEAQIKAIEKVAELIQKVVTVVIDVAKRIYEVIKEIAKHYRGTRVIYLATKHKDPKVRKKNTNRILRWVRRYMRCRE